MKKDSPYDSIVVAKLKLDPNNPRLPEVLRSSKSEKDVLEWMLTDATLLDLMASIAENGFFEGEPIIAMKDGDDYVVLEGNRRLAAVKLLQNPNLSSRYGTSLSGLAQIAKEKGTLPENLTVFICQSREDVENYLGFRHVSGVKPWPPISKARYAHHLFLKKRNAGHQVSNELFKELAREIGSKAGNVRRMIYSYLLFKEVEKEKFFRIQGLDEDNFEFSLLAEAAFKFGEISKYMGIDVHAEDPLESLSRSGLENVVRWHFEKDTRGKTRVGESRNMRMLDDVLKVEASRQAFLDGVPLKDAALLTTKADDNFVQYLGNAKQWIQQANNAIHQIRFPKDSGVELLNEISVTVRYMKIILEEKIEDAKRVVVSESRNSIDIE